jgi:chromosome segregation ATPase
LSLLDHRGSTALAAPTLSPADVENDGAYELWEPERLGRQVAIYEAEVAALLTRTAELGRESDQLRQELHATEETTRRLEETLRRGEETARSAKERSAALQASLDEITTSRAWRAVVRYRRLRTAIRGPRRPRT